MQLALNRSFHSGSGLAASQQGEMPNWGWVRCSHTSERGKMSNQVGISTDLKKIKGDTQNNNIIILLLAFYFMVLLSGCQSLPLINSARILPKDQHELLLGYLY